ncbi:protein NipSnap homolog 3A isoform X3 [Ursus maritimus]|uniref:Protein NipSnap homolog 3A isoform X3 n=1 Tax=Ursus maritimus TaxID=29073 RepID=A0A8M1FZF0_URSMA|nr:protein NipSnap homolog 3A isoform X3 [Ursus maritimus]
MAVLPSTRSRAMLALRSGLTRALAARTLAPQVYSSFATGPRQYDGTFYEFRTYCLKPSKMNEFLENAKKYMHLRTAYSELVGFWSVEFGGQMNKVFHIWKYDNFAHQTEVRKAVAKDKEWQQIIVPNLALIDEQENEITYLVPWCKLEKPAREAIRKMKISAKFMFFGGMRVQTVVQLGDISLTRIPGLWRLFGRVSITSCLSRICF